jgi:hypothetical protein
MYLSAPPGYPNGHRRKGNFALQHDVGNQSCGTVLIAHQQVSSS